MQFKNPEVLYFFALLIIPILVHLFQLQKFVKVPFTNVAFLQKLQQQTRKSSRIKKWLILATRLLLFSAILLAFSQPYFSDKNIDKKQHTFIYLDNSLSTNTKGEKGNLLKISAQEIIESANEKDVYSLQTNSNFYKDISKNELKNLLLKIENTSKKLDLSTIFLKINQLNKNKTNTLYKNILISDFQNTYKNKFTNVTPAFSAVKLESSQKNNLSIDSVFISNANTTNFTVNAIIKNQGEEKSNTPISIFNNENLVSKQSFNIDKDSEKTIQFTIQNKDTFLGKIQLTFSDTFPFDNTYFFSINKRKKASVLAIGKESHFLSKIYTKDAFNFTNATLQNVNYNAISKQQLIILNSLENIPEILAQSLLDFSKNGGSLVIIPNEKLEVNSYNSFFNKLQIGKLQNKIIDTLKITSINYNHPLFKNVFSKKVNNFQYPSVNSLYPIFSKNSSTIISFENNTAFISELKNNIYYVSSSLAKTNSNFVNSPLIVPVFYNFGQLSFQFPRLSYRVATENKIGIETQLGKDEILTIANSRKSFIPLQQTFQNSVVITTKEQPLEAGIYSILKEKDTLQNIAFNYPKEESSLKYLDLNTLAKNNKNIEITSSIPATFNALNKKNEVQWLWKWFLALAIVSLLLEILILKFYKP
ncbi:BatA domain-containing protein [Polaribacter batillariae]|uniref:BatA domain-containing protein n=1 Tax=Polaribacter batillariae TaxID=2808900 RepID=A0ABX7STV4_9FLAO|nr:BatA domain-containing protein [Polaribacter batillariae]QTD37690.1 BatA domain-containing protein [Polaribacter batillariae]